MSSEKKEFSYSPYLERRARKSYGWEVRFQDKSKKRYFSLNFSGGGYSTTGSKTLKEQVEDYFSHFENVNPEITNYYEKNTNQCGVRIIMTDEEHTIYKKIIG